MNLHKSLSWKSVAAIVALTLTVPVLAQKRRAVAHPSPAAPAQSVTVTGKVLDAVTGAPVASAVVRLGTRSDRTDRTGAFQIFTSVFGPSNLTAERSGYVTGTGSIPGGGTHEITIHVQPTPTVKVRLVNGNQFDVDFESLEFGYIPPFGSYSKSSHEDFCKPDGTKVVVDRSQISRITGPATQETASACCTGTPQKVTVALKTGETSPMYFSDSCAGLTIDLIARDHVTGSFVYTRFSEIAEVIFP